MRAFFPALGLVLSLLFLACAPAHAKQQGLQLEHGTNFGVATCRPPVPCPSYDSDVGTLVARATACAQRRFAFSSNDLFAMQEPDSAGCLTTTGSQFFGSSTRALAPHCCFVPMEENPDFCVVQCEVLAPR